MASKHHKHSSKKCQQCRRKPYWASSNCNNWLSIFWRPF